MKKLSYTGEYNGGRWVAKPTFLSSMTKPCICSLLYSLTLRKLLNSNSSKFFQKLRKELGLCAHWHSSMVAQQREEKGKDMKGEGRRRERERKEKRKRMREEVSPPSPAPTSAPFPTAATIRTTSHVGRDRNAHWVTELWFSESTSRSPRWKWGEHHLTSSHPSVIIVFFCHIPRHFQEAEFYLIGLVLNC